MLLPTDLTLYFLHLIRCALNLVQEQSCYVILLYVAPVSTTSTDLLPPPSQQQPDAEFSSIIEQLKKLNFSGVEGLEIARLHGKDSSYITKHVLEEQIDLVLSTISCSRSTAALSFRSKLLQDVLLPVPYGPGFSVPNNLRQIVFVLDVEAKNGLLPNQELIELRRRKECLVSFLLVTKPGFGTDALTQPLSRLHASPMLAKVADSGQVVPQRNFTQGIVAFIKKFEVDLVVNCKKKSMLDHLHLGQKASSSERASATKVPCLSVA